jgi:error-prone DNA polymerase
MTTDRSPEEMEKVRQTFLDGCADQGVDAAAAEATWKALSAFAAYGFCKAHAAAFARIAYQTAYLKTYYPAEFLTGILNNQPMGFYSSHTILQEARRMGIHPLRPDINRSAARWTVEGDGCWVPTRARSRNLTRNRNRIFWEHEHEYENEYECENEHESTAQTPEHPSPGIRVGLKQVKGITQADLDSIAAARTEGPFTSLADFCIRTTVPRDVVENLILCGAFDTIEPNHRALYWEMETALAARTPAVAPEEGQLSFGVQVFRCSGVQEDASDRVPAEGGWSPLRTPERLNAAPSSTSSSPSSPVPVPPSPGQPPTLFERVRWEVDVLGLSPTVHPTVLFREQLAPHRPRKIAALAGMPNGARVTTAGILVCRMRPPTKSGATVVFITLEDETGLIDTVLFPDAYDRYGVAAFASNLLVVEGKLQRQGARDLSLILEKVINPLKGWVEPEIEGRTGVARREVAVPWLGEDEDKNEITLDYQATAAAVYFR